MNLDALTGAGSSSGMSHIVFDMKEWQSAMQEYLAGTSRDVYVALNGKTRDLHYRASKASPVGKTKAQYRGAIYHPPSEPYKGPGKGKYIYQKDVNPRGVRAVSVWRIRDAGRPVTREELAYRMKYLGSGKGYAKSAWIKAVNKIPKNASSALGTPPMSAAKFRNSSASVQLATINSLSSWVRCEWLAQSMRDAQGKQAMHEKTLSTVLADQVIDMQDHMRQRAAERALKHTGRIL